MSNIKFKLRTCFPEDINFILNSWVKGLSGSCPYRDLDKTWTIFASHSLALALLQRSEVVVACSQTDDWHILGYCVYSRFKDAIIIHWGHVKKDFRSEGIFTALLDSIGEGPRYFTTPFKYNQNNNLEKRFKWQLKTAALNWVLQSEE